MTSTVLRALGILNWDGFYGRGHKSVSGGPLYLFALLSTQAQGRRKEKGVVNLPAES